MERRILRRTDRLRPGVNLNRDENVRSGSAREKLAGLKPRRSLSSRSATNSSSKPRTRNLGVRSAVIAIASTASVLRAIRCQRSAPGPPTSPARQPPSPRRPAAAVPVADNPVGALDGPAVVAPLPAHRAQHRRVATRVGAEPAGRQHSALVVDGLDRHRPLVGIHSHDDPSHRRAPFLEPAGRRGPAKLL